MVATTKEDVRAWAVLGSQYLSLKKKASEEKIERTYGMNNSCFVIQDAIMLFEFILIAGLSHEKKHKFIFQISSKIKIKILTLMRKNNFNYIINLDNYIWFSCFLGLAPLASIKDGASSLSKSFNIMLLNSAFEI